MKKTAILSKLLLLLALLPSVGCERVTNTIATIRLDCGGEVDWQDPYVKFVDAIGNPLPQNLLEYRSLEGQSLQTLNLSSKGCVALDKTGLWLIRHREKPEGLVLDFSKIQQSTTLGLQDISGENLKPECPAYEAGSKLNLSSVLGSQVGHDIRGYEISFAIQSDKIQKSWPKQNFSMLRSIELAGVFPEGQVKLEIIVTNNFRGGEQSLKTCPVKFDYTGPVIMTSLAQGQNMVYKGRPFVSLGSDQDVRFKSSADDFSAFDVCYISRPDWNVGEVKEFLPLCEKPERIAADRPVPFETRQGFWQLYYRGVDPAGNMSDWSEPMMILLEQKNARLQIVNKAVKQASEINSGGYGATPFGMLSALEIYNAWQKLPTVFEREQLESSILLSMHRPWMEPSVKVYMRVVPPNYYPKVAFPVAKGKKFVSIEIVSQPTGEWKFNASLTDVNTFREVALPAPETLPDGWQVSQDGTKFFWFTMSAVFYGKLVGDDVKVQKLDFEDDYVSAVRFLRNDSQVAVVTSLKEDKLRFYEADEQLTEVNSELILTNVLKSDSTPSTVSITDDARGVWLQDTESNSLKAWSLFEDGVKTPLDFNPELIPDFDISADSIRVLDTDKHLFVTYTYTRYNFCSFYSYNAELPERERAKMLLEAMNCSAKHDGTALGSEVWMKGEGDHAVVVYNPGSASFRRSVLNPELPVGTIDYSTDRFVTDSGRWMFSGSTEYGAPGSDRRAGRVRAWNRKDGGEFQLVTEFWACGESADPKGFQFHETNQVLIHSCGNYEDKFFVWNISVNPPQLIETFDIGTTPNSILLLEDAFLIATSKGEILFYDLHGYDKPTLSRTIKLVDQSIIKLTYDSSRKLLYTMEARGEKPLKTWNFNNLTKPIRVRSALPREMQRTTLSGNKNFLAASSQQYGRVIVWDTEDLKPLYFDEHSAVVVDAALVGESPLLVSGSAAGTLKIWDFKNPDVPAVTFFPGLTKGIKNIAAVPGGNEFVVETEESRMFHYRLDSMEDIVTRTCEVLRAYLHYTQENYPEQAARCQTLSAPR